MDFLELTKKRYSVRSYTSQEVEKEKFGTRPQRARHTQGAQSGTHHRTCFRESCPGRKPSGTAWLCRGVGTCVRTLPLLPQSRLS